MAKRGRPAVFDDEKKRTVCLLIRAGCSQRRAAQYVGIDEATVRRTAERDPAFHQQLDEAAVALELDCLTKIRGWTDRSWRAAAWLLKHRLPKHYSGEPPKPKSVVDAILNQAWSPRRAADDDQDEDEYDEDEGECEEDEVEAL